MRSRRSIFYAAVFFFILALAGCTQLVAVSPTQSAPPTPTLAALPVDLTGIPDARLAAQAYLEAWKTDDYGKMYSMLTSISRDAISAENFEKFYRGVATEGAFNEINFEILSSLVLNPTSAQVNFRTILSSELVGDLTRDILMNLSLENGQWRVKWDEALLMPELANGNYLGMQRFIPSRANIYDKEGHALVAQIDATAVGLRPALINPDQREVLYSIVERLVGLSQEEIQAKIEAVPADADWYVPLGELPAGQIQEQIGDISGLSGLMLSPYKARYYFDGGIAPHLIGYVGQIQQGQEEEYLRKGYRIDERVGQAGLEKWGEDYLSGTRGGALYVYNPQGGVVTKLAETAPRPSQAIYTTLNKDFQLAAQQALDGFRGAIVVLERDTGRVLAMVSSPGFDPNAFEPLNLNYYTLQNEIYGNPANPLINRATQGQYPLGSVFKIITTAAALESGLYSAQSTYHCGYFFEELAGVVLNDWTYEYYLQDKQTMPSGLLTLPEGLIRSCNPWFWHIGLDLYNQDRTKAISDMARSFGLAKPTGIEGVPEEAGNIPDPVSQIDATNLAIGQGETLVTPLQVATFIAAIGNGGTLYKPQVVERIVSPDGEETHLFKPEKTGQLPLSDENLAVIQEAMRGVVVSTRPYGTAWHRFTGLDIPVYGKTGTAQSGSGDPHAWFAGYTEAGREDLPDIAAAVIVENIGEGSDYAAPIFRRIVEEYFYGQPAKVYPWESSFYVNRTPEPEITPQP